MSLHDDLLAQSIHLLRKEPRRPRQASLRRAVSSSYYALFHLLIYEASRIFVKDHDTIGMIARSYGHTEMLKVSKEFVKGHLPKKLHPLLGTYSSGTKKVTFEKIKSMAQTFVELQEARHEADYNLRKIFTRKEAEGLVNRVERAFLEWKEVRTDDLSRIYVSCFLVTSAWDKER